MLTSKRYPCSGGAKHLSESFADCAVHVHPQGQAALETGDFFTTWANRFDSDMPPIQTQSVADGDVFALGDGQVESVELPGHSLDGMGGAEGAGTELYSSSVTMCVSCSAFHA